ncbi:cyclic AMP-dependent transcription factor ATF-6 beta-like [Asterias amurensis]|uniref:cyclic AMP-dependent transcription factor ATF-6 beta-like n=1 Tax=Asterias amurensis TaxID=7602 RepID=UPI003AB67CA7
MALDFISSSDTRFLADNLLSSEDFGDDFTRSYDDHLNNGFADAEELVRDFACYQAESMDHIPTDHTMLDNTSLTDFLNPDVQNQWMEEDQDQNSCTIGGLIIKSEPLSPPPSSSSSDASGDTFPAVKNFPNPYLQVKLESPPLTPPRDSADVSNFTLTNGTDNCSTTVVPTGITIGPKKTLKPKGMPIAPKPATGHIQKPSTNVRQPLVLTQADVAQLTAQGIIKCGPPPTKQAKMSPSQSVASVPIATKTTIAVTPDEPHQQGMPSDVDMRAWKRQQRMIKNRESACLSRKKKKEYLQGLEGKMDDIDSENTRLREENCLLRKRVEELQKENNRLRKLQSMLPSAKKTTTCLFALVLLLGFNLAPFSIFSSQKDDYSATHHGRALLGYSEPSTSHDDQSPDGLLRQQAEKIAIDRGIFNTTNNEGVPESPMTRKELMVIRDMAEYMLSKGGPSCPKLNMTESHRLADVLMGWAQNHQDEQKKYNKEQQIKKQKMKAPRKKPTKRNPFKRAPPTLQVDPNERSLQVYDSLFQRTYDSLLDALNRRDDTFYVVSFRRDHMLLPATAHNNTQRPRMSLVMPSVGVNESSLNTPKDHISMMQIDCEVMNTKMVYIKEGHIPGAKNNTVANHTTVRDQQSDAERPTSSEGADHSYHPKNLTLPPS